MTTFDCKHPKIWLIKRWHLNWVNVTPAVSSLWFLLCADIVRYSLDSSVTEKRPTFITRLYFFWKIRLFLKVSSSVVLFLCHFLSSRLCYTRSLTIQLCMPLGTRVTLHDCVCAPVASLFPFASMEECVENNTCHLHRRSECSSMARRGSNTRLNFCMKFPEVARKTKKTPSLCLVSFGWGEQIGRCVADRCVSWVLMKMAEFHLAALV